MHKLIQKLSHIPRFFVFILFIIIGLVLYISATTSPFMADDIEQIVRSPLTQSVANIPLDFTARSTFNTGGGSNHGLYYKPVLLVFFTIGYTLGMHSPWLLHVIQILFHIANSLLVFLVLKKFFPKIVSFLGGLLFLIHSVNIETVVYISNLQDVLFFFFGMCSLYILMFKHTIRWLVVAQILLLFSLFSKETGVLFFGIITLFLVLFESRKKLISFITSAIPVIALYALMRFGVAGLTIVNKSDFALTLVPLHMRILYIPLLFAFYTKAFFWPSDLFVFQIWGIKILSFYTFYGPLLLLGAFLAVVLLIGFLIKKKKQTIFLPFLFFSIWFFVSLLFHMQLIPLDATAAGRWLYLPEVGLIGMLCCIGITFLCFQKSKAKIVLGYIFIGIFFVLFIRSFIRVGEWQNQLTLFQHDWKYGYNTYTGDTKEFYYYSPMESLLAVELLNNHNVASAQKHFEHAASNAQDNYSKVVALSNLALLYQGEKQYDLAKITYKKLLTITTYYIVYNNYADFLVQYDTPTEAEKFITYALTIYPKNAQLWYDLSLVKNALHDATASQKALLQAKAYDPLIEQKNQPQGLPNSIPLHTNN